MKIVCTSSLSGPLCPQYTDGNPFFDALDPTIALKFPQ